MIVYYHILSNVDQPPCKVTCVCGFKGSVCQTFTRAVCRDKIFKNCKALFEVRPDGYLDNLTARLSHKPPHTRKLPYLLLAASCPGLGHDKDRVVTVLVYFKLSEHFVCDLLVRLGPEVNNPVIPFLICYKTVAILILNTFYFSIFIFNNVFFNFRDNDVRH